MTSLIPKLKQPRELLNHILDLPELPAIVQNLDAGVLTKLIRHVGLEDSAQIVSLVTADQLKDLLDEDLWHSEAPGRDETFNAERFGLWLEVMMENGSAFAARKVMELDEDLVTLGLCQLVVVVGIHDPALRAGDDQWPGNDNILEKVLDNSLNQEFGTYLMIAKNESSWDTVYALMTALNESDYDMLIRLLDRCRWISGEQIEDNGGLYHVLTADEMLAEDVSSERQERREGRGFVTPTSAAVFLSQARSTPLQEIIAAKTMDHITRAYFKTAEMETKPAVRSETGDKTSKEGVSESTDLEVIRFIQTLRRAEVLPASDRKRLRYDGAESWDHSLPLTRAMRLIDQTDPDLCSQRLMELSYLSNTLISGCGFQGRAFQPKEAAEAALAVCNLGSEYLFKTDAEPEENQPINPWTALLKVHHLVKLFQVGWKILFDDVVLHTAQAVLEFINQLNDEMRDPEQVYEMTQMSNMLCLYILSGRPWEFNDQIDYLQIFLDGETTMAIARLLQEYPTLSKAICKKGGHRLSPFIRSQTHIKSIRRYLKDEL